MPDVSEKWVIVATPSGEFVGRTVNGMGVMDVRAALSSNPFVLTLLEPCALTYSRGKDGEVHTGMTSVYGNSEDDIYYITEPILRFCGIRPDSVLVKRALAIREDVRAKRSGIIVPVGAGRILGIDEKPR
jgi:hypothetical protein